MLEGEIRGAMRGTIVQEYSCAEPKSRFESTSRRKTRLEAEQDGSCVTLKNGGKSMMVGRL